MDKKDIISFFDEFAPTWDNANERNDAVITKILDNSGIFEGTRVLDVACGTGVLFPDYISRNAKVTGIDISAEMVKVAKEKFPQIEVICGDAESFSTDEKFDVIMLYNAFPHFPSPEKLIESLAKLLKNGGRISIAHGASREEIHKCHSEKANNISLPLPEAEELKRLLSPLLNVDIMISDDKMYQVSGTKKQP